MTDEKRLELIDYHNQMIKTLRTEQAKMNASYNDRINTHITQLAEITRRDRSE